MSEADELTVVVLAAGGGTRMKSKTMKVLHHIGGRSMIGHVLTAVRAVEPHRVVAVVGHQREQVGAARAGARARRRAGRAGGARRHGRRGPGGAGVERYDARHGRWSRPGTPRCWRARVLRRFVADHRAAEQVVSILSGVVADPFGYGRIVRNDEGDVEAIVEEKDAIAAAAGDPRDQLGDPRLRRGVPGRGPAAADQRQRQGRVLPHRHREDRPRGRPHGRRVPDRRRRARPRAPTTASSSPRWAGR